MLERGRKILRCTEASHPCKKPLPEFFWSCDVLLYIDMCRPLCFHMYIHSFCTINPVDLFFSYLSISLSTDTVATFDAHTLTLL